MNGDHQTDAHISILSMWHFEWIIYILILAVVYYLVVGPLTKRFGQKENEVTIYRQISFYFGLFLLFVAYGSPVTEMGEQYLFSAHMISMAIVYLSVPPLLLVGTPAWLARKVLELPAVGKIVSFMTKPLIAILLFNLFFSIYHVPVIFDYAMTNLGAHMVYHYGLLLLAIFMWWPVICPVPEKDSLSELQKMGYIFANGVLLTPACALLIFGDSIIYNIYVGAPQLVDSLPPVTDQQMGGIIMKIAQEIVYGCVLGFVFVQWVQKQKKQDIEEEGNDVQGYGYLEVSHDPRV